MNVREIIQAANFRCNKALGQNFVTDENLLAAIVSDSGVAKDDTVVEIGTGAGTLTRALSVAAEKIFSFEIDRKLEPVLALSLQGLNNVEVVFRDVLKLSDEEVSETVGCGPFKVVANLPYYVTTPLLMRFLESGLPVESLTVMVQEEVARRFVARPDTEDYSAVTLAIETCGKARIMRKVGREMFFPSPNVDSAVVRIDVDRRKLDGENAPLIRRLIRAAFAMRRKTLANNLSAGMGMSKPHASDLIEKAGFSPLVRGEALGLADYILLSRLMSEKETPSV